MSNATLEQLSPYVMPGLVAEIKGDADTEEVIKEICFCYNVDPEVFHKKLKSNERRFVVLRQVYFYVMRRYSNFSLMKIGNTLNKDHATVIYSVKQVETALKFKYKDFYPIVIRIERNLSIKFRKYEH